MKSVFKYWVPVLIWLCVIFIGSTDVMSAEQTSRFLVPFLRWLKPDILPEAIEQIQFFVRKLGHISEYAVLAVFLWRALRWGINLRMKMSILVVVVWFVCSIFAATDEFHQSFIPSRTPSPHDVMIDICGAVVGLAICMMFAVWANRKSEIEDRK
jgi:VanZ family protein